MFESVPTVRSIQSWIACSCQPKHTWVHLDADWDDLTQTLLYWLFWDTPKCDCWELACLKKHTNRGRVPTFQFNLTSHCPCESTLRWSRPLQWKLVLVNWTLTLLVEKESKESVQGVLVSYKAPARVVPVISHWMETLGQNQDLPERLYHSWMGISVDQHGGAGMCDQGYKSKSKPLWQCLLPQPLAGKVEG